MNIEDTEFQGLKIVRYFTSVDQRGSFVKPWYGQTIAESFGGMAETYFSHSHKGVLRGLHYQRGTSAQKKYVTCLSGAVEDIALDMRTASKTYGKVFRIRLAGMDGVGVIVPEGFAHGIFAHEESVIVNFCDKVYAPGDESGVDWSSVPELSDLKVTVLSAKDKDLPRWTGGSRT
jgi:dTDP-4-dehydrorhamnose 3,5-epimerase